MKKYQIVFTLILVFSISLIVMGGENTVKDKMNENPDYETIVFGGGCFWCLEPIFEELNGVEKVVVGYAGGHVPNPTYAEVCDGNTGHAEVIEVTFRPEVISLEEILHVFFTIHDPTTLNRQGADAGTQYRSVILYRNEDQKQIAENVIGEIENKKIWDNPVVTEIGPLEKFYEAEDYHQDYFVNNSNVPYCRIVIAPKVDKFRKDHSSKLK